MVKQCANCGKINNITNVYCVGCKKILRGKKKDFDKKIVIATPSEPEIEVPVIQKKDKYYLLCPSCGCKEYVEENGFALMCSICGYFFEEGIDIPVKEIDDHVETVKPEPAKVDEVVQPKKSNPLRRGPLKEKRVEDNTLLRIYTSRKTIDIDIHGDYIGGLSAYIWRTSKNGWYIRADDEGIMLNNDIMNRGVERQLRNGSTILIDYELYKVEIYE